MNNFSRLKNKSNKTYLHKIPKVNNDGKTFEEWKKLGYYVMKGEKSKHRNKEGKSIFTFSQVSEMYDYDEEKEKDRYYNDDNWDLDELDFRGW